LELLYGLLNRQSASDAIAVQEQIALRDRHDWNHMADGASGRGTPNECRIHHVTYGTPVRLNLMLCGCLQFACNVGFARERAKQTTRMRRAPPDTAACCD
jgi:hypothetical protein